MQSAVQVAQSIGAVFSGKLHQIDTYFQCQRGRLKLREINGSSAELIFYQRAEDGSDRISHYEQYAIDRPEVLKEILSQANGVRAMVEKHRLVYLYGDTRIHLDDVRSLGFFLEFEVPMSAPPEGAKEKLDFLRGQFDIRPKSEINRSYADLIIEESGSLSAASPAGR